MTPEQLLLKGEDGEFITPLETRLTAKHEVGHMAVAEHYGIDVYELALEDDGRGFTDIGEHDLGPEVSIQISVAGMVSEALALGIKPKVDYLYIATQFEDDLKDIQAVTSLLEGDEKAHIDKAIQTVYSILRLKSAKSRRDRTLRRLLKNHYVIL